MAGRTRGTILIVQDERTIAERLGFNAGEDFGAAVRELAAAPLDS